MVADGQLLIAATGGNANAATLTAGAGITITNGANSIQIDATAGALTWSRVAGPAVAMSGCNGYIPTNAALVTLTLPATAAVGEIIEICGEGAGGWSIAQNAGQTIRFGVVASTAGVGGSLDSTDQYDCVRLVCRVANTDFSVLSSVGNLNVV